MAKLTNLGLVDEMVKSKMLNVQRHPTADLWLYNYSSMCQIYHAWNDVTTTCRGLVCDGDYNIVARPFVKFFNYEEIEDKSSIPVGMDFEVFDKLDGSLGIMYWIGDVPYITTRGSFVSDQGKHATKVLHERYAGRFGELDRSKTYLFEIIYPDDHHCISYGQTDDIFLLAVIDTETGEESDIREWSHIFKCAKKYDGVTDFLKIREMFDGDNREGFVVKFANNYRIKMKYESYFKIAFIMNHLSEKVIIEAYEVGTMPELAETISQLNEENQIYFREIREKLEARYREIRDEAKELYREFDTDKDAAMYFLQYKKLSGILFNMRKGADYSACIWKIIKNEAKERNKNKEEG